MTLLESLKNWLAGKSKTSVGTYVGRNDRKCNHNKYGKQVATDGNCVVLPSGAIAVRYIEQKPRTSKKAEKRKARRLAMGRKA